jgi:hypothetical protein
MPSGFIMDEPSYESMLEFLLGLGKTDIQGGDSDIRFIRQDFWLQDTAVIENIEFRHGEWNIYLVFAHHLIPLKFIKRRIISQACPRKASIIAHYMRRQAAKDQRGTLTVGQQFIHLSFN